MAPVVKCFLVALFSISSTLVLAQKPKPATTKPATFQKFTPPKLISILGIRSDTAIVYKEEAIQLVKLPLKVTDSKKNVYTISSYHMQYKRLAVTEDEESGKVSQIFSTVSDLFTETPLPARWTNILTEQIRAGEQLFFYDIVAKDAQGRLMFAPNLTIKIK